MTKILQLFFLVVIFSFLTTCMRNMLEVNQTNFKEEIAQQENLKFTFNNPIATDNMLNVWDTTAYLNFTPKVAGKFKWLSATELIFSPLQGFEPSTDYQAKLNPVLTASMTKKTPIDPEKIIKFHTTYLKLDKVNAFWSLDDRKTNQLRLNLHFNYKVQPNNLKDLISIKTNNAENIGNVRVLNSEISNTVELLVEEVSGMDLNDKELSIEIAAGIKCAESEYISKAPLKYTLTSPNKNKLAIESITAEYEKGQGQIRVLTNQAVSLVEILNNMKLEPKMVYEVKPLEAGFVIKGNFEAGRSYTVKINNELRGVFGVALKEDIEQSVTFGAKESRISFADKKGKYLSSKGNKNIGIHINNVPKVELKVYKIFENNLTHFLKKHDQSYEYNYYQEDNYYDIDAFGDLIYQQTYETKSLPLVNDFQVLNMDFDNLKQSTKGIYVVKVNSTENQYTKDTKIISISDIGFMVRETGEDFLVFANSIIDAQAIQGVQIKLVSQSNQILSTLETDKDGVALFKDVKKKFPDANIKLITAQKENDFNYLNLSTSEVDKSRFETGGKNANPSGYQAFIYGERDLYRPSETINLNMLVRDKNWKPVSNIPIKFKLKTPNGKDLVNIKGNLSNEGSFAQSIKIPESSVTGTYSAEIYTSTDVFLESMPISVEEFMPDRIKVRLQLTEKDYQTNFKGQLRVSDSVRVMVQAVNLFGPPAVDRDYQMRFELNQKIFKSKNYKDYNFAVTSQRHSDGYDNLFYNLAYKSTEGRTDAKGKIYESFKIPDEYANMGLLQGKTYTTVFDETGRPVIRSMVYDVFTQNAFIGIRNAEEYISTNQPFQLNLIALDTKQMPTQTQATVQVIRYRWQTVLEKSNEYSAMQYVSKRKDEILKEENITIGQAGAVYNFTPQFSGDYEILVKLPNAKTFVSHRFYAYGYGNTENTAFEVSKDGRVEITFDKEKYKIGEQAKVLFTTPFNGKLLVTVEKDKVFQYFYLNTQNKSASTTINLNAEHLPNVYITATLIRPLSDGAIPLTVAHGFEPLAVEDDNSKLNLTIEAVEKTETNQKQTIKVKADKAEEGIEITLAVVDEGILQIKDYETPDPHKYFFQKRALNVSAYDLYPLLFPEISLNKSSTGGDGGDDLSQRGSPMVSKRVKLVRFWSGVLKTNAMGEVTYTIDVPQFSGSLRIMALAYKGNRFGSADKKMTVADPVVVSTGLPRFLSPMDKIQVPVVLFNTTNAPVTATVQMEHTNNLIVNGEKTQNITIKANGESQVSFDLEARPVIDSAKVKVRVQALGKTFTEELDINIRPIVGLVKSSGFGVVNAGMNQNINFPNDFFANTGKAELMVSKSPLVQFAGSLDYVINYPYGCVEQVTSSVFPQLYAQELMQMVTPQKQNLYLYEQEIKENVQEGIMKLQSMQNYSGGLSYWQGDYESHLFGTAYASHFLIEAKKIGYQVMQSGLDQMLSYLRNQTDNRSVATYFFTDEKGKRRKKQIANKESIYALYVLALAKNEDISTMNYYKENPELLALDSKYLLASAYLLLGDPSAYQTLLPSTFEGEISEHDLNKSFHSPVRDEALVLNALLEVDENNVQIPRMAQHLTDAVRKANSLNTNENAFALMALGKLSKRYTQNNPKGKISNNGNLLANFGNENLALKNNLLGNRINISAEGSPLYYFWQTEGLSATGKVKEEDNRLKVRKTFYTRDGKQIMNNVFRQNDLVVVKVTLVAEPYFANIDNVVITDMIPAGFEIENPRLTDSETIKWIRGSAYPDHFDIKDDRINYFTTAESKAKTFYYLARAVTVGTFQMGPISADAMYNGDYHSYNGSGKIQIIERKNINN